MQDELKKSLAILHKEKPIFNTNIEDFKRIIQNCPEWLQWAFKTAFALSLRFGQIEVFSLQWSAFNWRTGSVILKQGKSGMLKKVFPPEQYLDEAYYRYQEDTKNGISLVCHKKGLRVLDYRRAWLTALKKAGLENSGIKPYDIRHLSATIMLNNGIDPVTVSKQLGHASPTTTMNFYAHTTEENQKSASQTLPSLE